jgi:hypothetical protein
MVLDLVKELHTSGHINNSVRACGVWSKAPDLAGVVDVPAKVVSKVTATQLIISSGANLTFVNLVTELGSHRLSLHVKTVVLVRGLGETHPLGLFSDSLAEGHDRVALNDRDALHEVLSKVLKADLKVKLTSSSNNVLTRL